MTKIGFTVWSWRFAILGLSLSVAVGCGKSSSPGGVDGGFGGGAGGSAAYGDAVRPDAPAATGDTGQADAASAGSIAIDAPSATTGAGGGGGFSTSGGATTGTGGGTTGTARLDGGLGGAGGTAGVTRNAGASGGRAGNVGGGLGGNAGGIAGNTGGRSAIAGASGQPDAGVTGGKISVDARSTAVDAPWFANDAGIKNCPASLVTGDPLKCEVGSPSICVVAGSYDTYHCTEAGWWARNPDKCPGLLTTGDTCTGEFTCLYPSYWSCTCPGMGFPASCGDIRTTGTLLLPRDAGPDADPHPALLSCPEEDPQGASCDWQSFPRSYCVRANSTNLCICVSGAWSCHTGTCPAVIDSTTPCAEADLKMPCLKDDDKVCTCSRVRSDFNGFYCF